jgi:hypothetical protein
VLTLSKLFETIVNVFLLNKEYIFTFSQIRSCLLSYYRFLGPENSPWTSMCINEKHLKVCHINEDFHCSFTNDKYLKKDISFHYYFRSHNWYKHLMLSWSSTDCNRVNYRLLFLIQIETILNFFHCVKTICQTCLAVMTNHNHITS